MNDQQTHPSDTTTAPKWARLLGVIAAVLVPSAAVWAVPHTFTSGDVISAAEMNENFTALETTVTDLEDQVATLQGQVATLETTATENHSPLIGTWAMSGETLGALADLPSNRPISYSGSDMLVGTGATSYELIARLPLLPAGTLDASKTYVVNIRCLSPATMDDLYVGISDGTRSFNIGRFDDTNPYVGKLQVFMHSGDAVTWDGVNGPYFITASGQMGQNRLGLDVQFVLRPTHIEMAVRGPSANGGLGEADSGRRDEVVQVQDGLWFTLISNNDTDDYEIDFVEITVMEESASP